MALLKSLVIGMGVLIVAGMGLLAYGLMTKTGGPDEVESAAMALSPLISLPVIEDIVIPQSGDCEIADVGQEGATLRVTLDGSADCRGIVLIDLLSGRINTTVRLAPSP